MIVDRIAQMLDSPKDGQDDISYSKMLIKNRLLGDSDVLEVLNNPELDPSVPEDYYGSNIFSRIVLPGVQPNVKNYICFEVDDVEVSYSNNLLVDKEITFMAVSHQDDIDTEWGVDRHDLLGYLIKDLFNWSNILGTQIKKCYDVAEVADSYYLRVIKFKMLATNGLTNGVTRNRHDTGN